MGHVNILDCAISKNAPLYHLTDPETRLDEHDLVTAGNLPDVAASEISSGVNRSFNVIVFNIPDHTLLNGLRDQMLAAGGMVHIPCLMTRLWKKTECHGCLFILQFQTKIPA